MHQQNPCIKSTLSVERASTRRVQLYRAVDRAGVIRSSAAEECTKGRLLTEGGSGDITTSSHNESSLRQDHPLALAERAGGLRGG